jgi:hypothetical protein
VNGIEGRIERLEAEEAADDRCPACGRHKDEIVMLVVRPHAREGRVPEDSPPAGGRPWTPPAACGHCGMPPWPVPCLFEDGEGRLWEYPDVRPEEG